MCLYYSCVAARKIPGENTRGNARPPSFEREVHGQKLECVAIPEKGQWSARLIQPDTPFGDRPAVAGRTWTTDLALAKRDDCVRFGLRVCCASLPFCEAEIAFSRPRVVKDIATQIGLQDVRPLIGKPWLLANEADLTALKELLQDPRRVLPVLLLTQPDPKKFAVQVLDYMLDAECLARKCHGIAHVALMPRQLGFHWTKMVSKPWSAFHGAVKTYLPNLSFDDDLPTAHPLAFAERIHRWSDGLETGEKAYSAHLVQQCFKRLASQHAAWGDLEFVVDAKTRKVELARARAKDDDDWLALLNLEIEAQKGKIKDLEQDCQAYNDDAIQSQRLRDYHIEENKKLRHTLDAMRALLEAKTGEHSDKAVPMPPAFADFPEWASQHLAGRLEFHARALYGLKKAVFQDIDLAAKALLLLANEYRNMCIGISEAKDAWEKGLNDLGLRFGGSITRERAGEEGETYFVRYPPGSNDRQFLEFHLRKGKDMDERLTLAIYFFWHEESAQVIVGWMPGHLPNRKT
jgi:hypothetical protein